MLQGEYYHELLRKYVVLFGTLFNNIYVSRYDASGEKTQQFKVPLSYGPREKFLAKLDEDPDLDRLRAITLPRISFDITGIQYDGTRKKNSLNKIISIADPSGLSSRKRMWEAVPYNITFSLTIMTRNTEDGAKIVEQILPNFTPSWTISAKLIDGFDNYVLDIPVSLSSASPEDMYTDSFLTRRASMWTLTFVMKGYFLGPHREAKIIKIANTNFYDSLTSNNAVERVTVKPGMTDEGLPTTYTSDSVIQATATASITANSVTGISMANTGIGYSNATITISAPSSNTGITAKAVPVISEDSIVAIKIINNGAEYDSVPTVTISAPDMATISHTLIDAEDTFDYVVITENL